MPQKRTTAFGHRSLQNSPAPRVCLAVVPSIAESIHRTVHVRLVFSFRMNSLSTEIILVNDYTSDVVFDI